MKLIKLSKGLYAKVDNSDYKKISRYTWQSHKRSNNTQYCARGLIDRKWIYMHRFILKAKSNQEVDHINLNPLDNRRCNIRLVNHSKNMANRISYARSGFKGVYRQRGKYDGKWNRGDDKWWVYIWVNGKLKYVGSYKNKDKAIKIYRKEFKKIYGISPPLSRVVHKPRLSKRRCRLSKYSNERYITYDKKNGRWEVHIPIKKNNGKWIYLNKGFLDKKEAIRFRNKNSIID
jgi:hypothetical protein